MKKYMLWKVVAIQPEMGESPAWVSGLTNIEVMAVSFRAAVHKHRLVEAMELFELAEQTRTLCEQDYSVRTGISDEWGTRYFETQEAAITHTDRFKKLYNI